MLFGNKENTSAEDFWRSKEEELGEPVLGKTLGRITGEKNSVPIWGLFYTTAKAVYFQTFESQNWLSMIFSGGKAGSRTKNETLEIMEKDIRVFAVRSQKGGLLRFMRQPPQIELIWTNPITGNTSEMLFDMEGDAEAFVATLPRTTG